MYLAYTPEQQALRKELRTYLDELLTDEVQRNVIGERSSEALDKALR